MTKLSLVKQKRCTLDENLKKELGHTQLLALDQHYLTFVTLEEEVAVNLLPQVTTFFPLSLSPFLFQIHIMHCKLYRCVNNLISLDS